MFLMLAIAQPTHDLNFTFGWFLVLAGFIVGGLLGLGFHRKEFMGGYDSFRRRLVRLGHISMEALGIINVVYSLCPLPAPGTIAAEVAGPLFILGGVAMPTVCFLAAWKPVFRHLFFIPVTSLFCAVALTAFSGV